ncbi:uncharacterized protein CANTADRAFT_26380 [Suhomyces tanzawaensis NRRL Y-17324]|uniref:Uncharacterized protein n=1 Tax=Suhomyces tanzawaensis NRRL Y-17324 TaxID=984487 RepID=A0A1E4SIX9_9ASCO|nr:uncharacterized protein CANTADRAFT_26380 [Suhomyces tanzawaensis NRRL Y-17324]ODV79466.1 hypothetical protein CANTADRAFT_26380 [Suhomyces tanzawaensis NRRL Y-17324]
MKKGDSSENRVISGSGNYPCVVKNSANTDRKISITVGVGYRQRRDKLWKKLAIMLFSLCHA